MATGSTRELSREHGGITQNPLTNGQLAQLNALTESDNCNLISNCPVQENFELHSDKSGELHAAAQESHGYIEPSVALTSHAFIRQWVHAADSNMDLMKSLGS